MSKDVIQTRQGINPLIYACDHYMQSLQPGEKVSLGQGKGNTSNYYLPPMKQAMRFLGWLNPTRQFIEMSEADNNLPLNIGRSSRYDLMNKGVGHKTISKFVSWIKTLPLPLERGMTWAEWRQFNVSCDVGSNASDWLISLYCFTSNSLRHHEFDYLIHFVRQRCAADVKCLRRGRRLLKRGELNDNNLTDMLQVQVPLWSENSIVGGDVWREVSSLLVGHQEQIPLSESQTLILIAHIAQLQFDFYLEAIACYEVGCVVTQTPEADLTLSPDGILTRGILFYVSDSEVNTCFGGFLKELKRVIAIHKGKLSWRQLASAIEVDEDTKVASGDSLNQKQRNRLKDWRNGRNLPSDEKLQSFLAHLLVEFDESRLNMLFIYCRIAIGLDKLVNDFMGSCEREACSMKEVQAVLDSVLARYPNYYLRHMEQHFIQSGRSV
jgi:hypothetical protein